MKPVRGSRCPRQRVYLYLFLFTLGLYCLSAYGFLSNPDNESVFQTTKSLVENRSLSLQDNPVTRLMIEEHFTVRGGQQGAYYSWFGIFLAIAWSPLYAIGACLQSIIPLEYPFYSYLGMSTDLWPRVMIGFFNSIITALTCVLVYSTSRLLDKSHRTALLTSLLYGFGTIALEYSRSAFSEPLVGLLVLVMFHNQVAFKSHGAPSRLLLAGCALALAMLTKSIYVLLVPVLVAYVFRHRRRLRLDTGIVLLPILSALLTMAVLNQLRFGDFWRSPYGAAITTDYFTNPIPAGMYGLTFSPGKGLFLYSPLLLLFFPSMFLFYRKYPSEGLFISTCMLLILGIYAKAVGWHGGLAWGPRYIMPLIPLMAVVMGEGVDRWMKMSAFKIGCILCVGCQVFLLCAYYPSKPPPATRDAQRPTEMAMHWKSSPLVWQYKAAAHNILVAVRSGDPRGHSTLTWHTVGGLEHFFFVWFYERFSHRIWWVLFFIVVVTITTGRILCSSLGASVAGPASERIGRARDSTMLNIERGEDGRKDGSAPSQGRGRK